MNGEDVEKRHGGDAGDVVCLYVNNFHEDRPNWSLTRYDCGCFLRVQYPYIFVYGTFTYVYHKNQTNASK